MQPLGGKGHDAPGKASVNDVAQRSRSQLLQQLLAVKWQHTQQSHLVKSQSKVDRGTVNWVKPFMVWPLVRLVVC